MSEFLTSTFIWGIVAFVGVSLLLLIIRAVCFSSKKTQLNGLQVNTYTTPHDGWLTPLPGEDADTELKATGRWKTGEWTNARGIRLATYSVDPVSAAHVLDHHLLHDPLDDSKDNDSKHSSSSSSSSKSTSKSTSKSKKAQYKTAAELRRTAATRAVVVFVHDFGDHQQRPGHMNVYKLMSEAGYSVRGFDMEGHGESDGSRGYIQDVNALARDIIDYTKSLQDDPHAGDCPVFLAGQGLGATIALAATQLDAKRFCGVAMFAPVLETTLYETQRKALWPVIERVYPSSWRVLNELYPSDMACRNLAAAHQRDADPLVYHGPIAMCTLRELLKLMSQVNELLPQRTTPLHTVRGGHDMIATPTRFTTSGDFAVHADTLTYNVSWHDLLHEPEAQNMVYSAVQFIDEQLERRQLAATLD
jgi:acylglycerol lipase